MMRSAAVPLAPATRFMGAPLVALPAALPAALWAVALWGRTGVDGLSARWLSTFLAGLLAVALWAVLTDEGRPARLTLLSLLPAGALAGAMVAALYGSETVYHRFVHEPVMKGIVLPASVALVLLAPGLGAGAAALAGARRGERLSAAGRALAAALRRGPGLTVAVTLGAVGLFQAFSLVNVATDDLIRYWSIADGLMTGAGYPVTEGVPGGGGFYLVDQPLFPLLILPAFRLVGHRYLALQLPLILANVAVPFVFYGLARAGGLGRLGRLGRLGALGLALAVLCFPQYQVYALGAAEPEPLWAVEAGLLLLLAMGLARPVEPSRAGVGRRLGEWILCGLIAAAAALTRPEGVLYAGAALAGLAWWYRRELLAGWRALTHGGRPPADATGIVLAGASFLVPVGSFTVFLWATFGVLSPTGWLRIAGVQYALPALGVVAGRDLARYAEGVGLPAPGLTGPLLAFLLVAAALSGVWRLVRRWPALGFVPVALLLNLVVIFLTPLDFAGDVLSPQTFLRHLSVLFPWLVPALATLLPREDRHAVPLGLGIAALLVAELWVLGSVTARDQAQLATILTRDPYVLATDLARAADDLPLLPFARGERGPLAIDPRFDYRAFRDRLWAAERPFDQHADDAGRAYILASGVAALAGVSAVVVGARRRPDRACCEA